jgi:hypothetical protein
MDLYHLTHSITEEDRVDVVEVVIRPRVLAA